MQLQEYSLFDLDVAVKFAQWLLHHVTYAPSKFNNAMSSCLGEGAFT